MALITLAIAFVVGYCAALAIYRLYFSPLAKFPGPKLAAVSKWYEAYYEIILKGKFSFHLDELHDRYGTIAKGSLADSSRRLIAVCRPNHSHHSRRGAYTR